MATINLAITVPDADVPRIVAALRYVFNAPDATQAQLVELFRQDARDKLVSLVQNYEEIQKRKAAETPPAEISAT